MTVLNKTPIPFTVWSMIEEMKLRGTFLQLAVDAEFIICMVIVKIFRERYSELTSIFFKDKKKGIGKDLNDMDMSERIEAMKIGLNKYNQPFYNKYKEQIEHLHTLRDERNAFAHQKMTFFEEDRDKVELTKIVARLKAQRNVYSLKKMWIDMNAYNASIRATLAILQSYLDFELTGLEIP